MRTIDVLKYVIDYCGSNRVAAGYLGISPVHVGRLITAKRHISKQTDLNIWSVYRQIREQEENE